MLCGGRCATQSACGEFYGLGSEPLLRNNHGRRSGTPRPRIDLIAGVAHAAVRRGEIAYLRFYRFYASAGRALPEKLWDNSDALQLDYEISAAGKAVSHHAA